jgi:hypothetical protein
MNRVGPSRGQDAAYADPRHESLAREAAAALQAGDDPGAERLAGTLVRTSFGVYRQGVDRSWSEASASLAAGLRAG